ncbi:hypothetical protein COL516b_006486 [Colletotrichum fioriniae]|nr:uncharacterized protein COL516b_006486 [Colletotrichum fioriniae]KAJ0303482.1 hypothetical protein COL516b_006486 [Colletotrichum fioriniae]
MATATAEADSKESSAHPHPHPQPQSQPQPQAQTQSQNPEPKPSSPYGYLFGPDKAPTPILDALLRAIALHIVTGCQHSMQPSDNDFDAPSVPALTLRGFVRWESIEILLSPEEHVPFIQQAVKSWNLKHPETGEPFPPDLPADALPSEPDAGIEKWHKKCAEKLRKAAVPDEEPASPKTAPARPTERDEPRVKAAYVHTTSFRQAGHQLLTVMFLGVTPRIVTPRLASIFPRGTQTKIDSEDRTLLMTGDAVAFLTTHLLHRIRTPTLSTCILTDRPCNPAGTANLDTILRPQRLIPRTRRVHDLNVGLIHIIQTSRHHPASDAWVLPRYPSRHLSLAYIART